jgi:hypothetical protein
MGALLFSSWVALKLVGETPDPRLVLENILLIRSKTEPSKMKMLGHELGFRAPVNGIVPPRVMSAEELAVWYAFYFD